MAWKCKECGCTKFIENYRNGYRQFEKYDKDGEPVYETLIDDDPELDIECENCGHSGYRLKNIAKWEGD